MSWARVRAILHEEAGAVVAEQIETRILAELAGRQLRLPRAVKPQSAKASTKDQPRPAVARQKPTAPFRLADTQHKRQPPLTVGPHMFGRIVR